MVDIIEKMLAVPESILWSTVLAASGAAAQKATRPANFTEGKKERILPTLAHQVSDRQHFRMPIEKL